MSLFKDRDKGDKPMVDKPALGGLPQAPGMIRKPIGPTVAAPPAEGEESDESSGKRTRPPAKHFEKHNLGDLIGDAPEQLAQLEDQLRSNPKDAELHMKRYQVVKQHGEKAQLFTVLSDALEFCQNTFFASKLSALYEEEEHYDKALDWRTKITRWTPDDPDAWRRLAHVSVRAGDLTRAEAAYTSLLGLRSTDENPLGSNFLEEVNGAGLGPRFRTDLQTMGLRLLEAALLSRPDSVALLETTARLASRASFLQLADQCYENLLKVQPEHAHVRTWKSELLRVYGREGLPDKWQALSTQLVADFRTYLQKNPRDGRSWLLLGRLFIQAGQNEEAVAALKQAQTCDSQDWQSVYELGKLLMKLGRREEAVKFYEEILDPYQSGGPERKSIRRALEKSLADLYFRLGRYKESLEIYSRDEEANTRFIAPLFEAVSDFDRAQQLYLKTVKQTPVDAEAYLKLAEFHARRGNWSDAEAVARKGLTCKNAFGDIQEGLHVALATAQMKTNQVTEAMATLDHALENAPESPNLWFRRVKLLHLSGRQQEGNQQAESVREMVCRQIACAPAASNLWSLLGDCNSLLSRNEEAEQAFLRALEYDKMDATAWRGLGALREKRKDMSGALECYKNFVLLDPIHLSTHPVRQRIVELETQLGVRPTRGTG